jgi:hypothetical protein
LIPARLSGHIATGRGAKIMGGNAKLIFPVLAAGIVAFVVSCTIEWT